MIKFTVKILLLISTLLFGVLLGIHQAEQGIFSLEGIKAEQQESVYIKKVDEDHVEVALLGESFTTQDLQEKKEKWKMENQRNKFSQLGHQLGNVVYTVSRKGAEWFADQLDRVL